MNLFSLLIPFAYAASSYSIFIPDRIVVSSWNGSPPQDVVYVSSEAGHIKAVSAMTGVFNPGQVLTPDNTVATAGSPQIVFFVVPNGKPCRDPTTGNPNGTPVFATGVFVDGKAPPGTVQQFKLSTTTVAIPSSNTLCSDPSGDFTSSSGSVTFQIGP